MARKGRPKRHGGRKAERPFDAIIGPTPEQAHAFAADAVTHVETARASKAWRRKPVIDMMHKAGQITRDEYDKLAYYADQAAMADKSPVRSCCDTSPRSGNGPGVSILSAVIETGRIERDLAGHGLLGLTRAVCVTGLTLTQWCIVQYGGRERYNGRGEFVAIVPISEKRHMRAALLLLKYAAGVITRRPRE